ncbi:MAG: HTH-type transcriptional repressor FabR [Proteobacteria bacterium]|nr:MAG: HTH-type transcriptional repressor FabR [Pseudomonadota bacterium]
MTDRNEQKLQTRRELLSATLRLSAEKGFASLSLREITKAAGITPTAFYRHFHDLDELGLALIDEVGLGLRQLLREARREIGGDGTSVRSSVEAFIRYIMQNSNLFRVLQGERQGSSSAFRKAIYTELGRFIEEIADELERRSLLMSPSLTGLAAEAVVAVAFTVGAEALDTPKHKIPDLTERLIKEVKMILRGAQRRPPRRSARKTAKLRR